MSMSMDIMEIGIRDVDRVGTSIDQETTAGSNGNDGGSQ